MKRKDFKDFLDAKTKKMYDDNEISLSEIDDLEIFEDIFLFSLKYKPSKYERFTSFEKNNIENFEKFSKSRIKKYFENEHARIICKDLFEYKK